MPMDGARDEIWPIDPVNLGTGLPLEGVRILDLSRVLAGPLAVMVASDLGADVIKIEAPSGDPVRRLAPPWVDGDATYYLAVNRNRRNVVLDLRSDEGRRVLRQLAECADAVVDNFLPTQAAALGITELRDDLLDVVWVSIGAAASGGPLADLPSFDLLAQARSGVMGVTGSEESGPTKAGIPIADVVTGLYGGIALMTGLFAARAKPGAPAHRFEAPLLESTMASLINLAAGYLGAGVEPSLLGSENASIAPYAPYATKDLPVLIAAGTQGEWLRLCSAMQAPELKDDERFTTNADRASHRHELRIELEAILSGETASTWIERLAAANVPCAPINSVAAAFAQPQIADGDLVADVELASGRVIQMVASPIRIDGVRPPIRSRPPLLGEHTEQFVSRPVGHR